MTMLLSSPEYAGDARGAFEIARVRANASDAAGRVRLIRISGIGVRVHGPLHLSPNDGQEIIVCFFQDIIESRHQTGVRC